MDPNNPYFIPGPILQMMENDPNLRQMHKIVSQDPNLQQYLRTILNNPQMMQAQFQMTQAAAMNQNQPASDQSEPCNEWTQMIKHNTLNQFQGKVIKNWTDYIEQNKPNNPIQRHLNRLAYDTLQFSIAVNTKEQCIHHIYSSVECCVERLIGTVSHPRYTFKLYTLSGKSMNQQLFVNDPMGKKLCNQCILLFVNKTNKCQDIIDKFYHMYCNSNSYISANPCMYYFTRAVLCYPLIIKYLLKFTKNIDKLFQILIFYLKEIKLNKLQHSYEEFKNPNEGYKITNKYITSIFIFEYNLCCILALFTKLIPYFSKTHLLNLVQLNFPQIIVDYISKSEYVKLKHIQSNIKSFYQIAHQSIKIANLEKCMKQTMCDGKEVYVSMYKNESIDYFIPHRNPTLCKLINVFWFLFKRMKRFKNESVFAESLNMFEEFSGFRFIEYKNHSIEDCLNGNVKNSDRSVTDRYKLHYFITWANGTKIYSVKRIKKNNIKLKCCSNDKCRQIRKYCKFKKCKGCELALYCSNQCQKYHWSHGHRRFCFKLR
eukprot:505204_1